MGVTRISYGAQALHDGLLRRLGRRHRVREVGGRRGRAAAGIPSISLDLLYDVPGQSLADWIGTLDAALELGPDHLSLYALTLDDPDGEGLTGELGDHLPTTSGARRWRQAARPGQDEDRAAAQYHHAVALLGELGWRGYEISNWARPGHESRHNLAYWQRRPYEAVGPGAHAFDGLTRRWNAARLDGYVAALTPSDGSRPSLPPGGQEQVDGSAAAVEATILGLRLDTGLPLADALQPPLGDDSAGRSPRSSWRWTANADRNGSASRPAVGCCRTSSSVDWSDGRRAALRSATRRRHRADTRVGVAGHGPHG